MKQNSWSPRERGLVDSFPLNISYLHHLWIAKDYLGHLSQSEGDFVEARRDFEEGVVIARRLVEKSPFNPDHARREASSYRSLGDLGIHTRDGELAFGSYNEAWLVLQKLAEQFPDNSTVAVDQWTVCAKIAYLYDQIPLHDEFAKSWWRKAWEILSSMELRGIHYVDREYHLKCLDLRFGFGRWE
jgi:hypothetical protein